MRSGSLPLAASVRAETRDRDSLRAQASGRFALVPPLARGAKLVFA
jgi:hypothetical protein